MSHIRNLLHKPFGHEQPTTTAAPVVAVPEHSYGPTAAATLPVVPKFPIERAILTAETRVVFHTAPNSPAADRFRLLRMRLKTFWNAGKLKKLLITSPLAHDGKSTVILNLAAALAERGKRNVLVLEADFHHSSLASRLQLKPWPGLADCLADGANSPLSSIRRIDPLGIYFMPAGEPRRTPTELLQTPAFGHLMQQVSTHFDWILIDSPPVVPLTDAISLQQHTDASLLVVRAGHTPREAIEQTLALLGKENVVGIVLNGMERRDQPHYQNAYYQYGSERESED